ncbi:hypothetical protein Taro_029699, partial [Colocasia esculenta]|nr:hypothetical protein [Colocasia esculenta]
MGLVIFYLQLWACRATILRFLEIYGPQSGGRQGRETRMWEGLPLTLERFWCFGV